MAGNKACMTRLQKEYKSLLKEPVPHVTAHPTNNLLEWHFVLEGAQGTEYEGGVYHGKIVFPAQYPFKPPSLSLFTPNGRFAVNTKLCLSMTDYHPESWNPMWSVGTILTGLLSFMHDPQPTTGSINTSVEEKKRFASDSLGFNMKATTFRKLFPEWVEEFEARSSVASTSSAHAEENTGATTASAANLGGQPSAREVGQRAELGEGKSPTGAGKNGQRTSLYVVNVAFVVLVLTVAVVPFIVGRGGGSQS
ncbi:hypothetical protein CEUSTIGMA_g9921.t1 [Chlamydomonas eustigma]|uniref:E2 ubiquitin-conjugating enzyme n=1 Tax=Chlamydomonas eustigma TaxID=1157962 RepID=A0A250XHE2_9CHLO|nr:hypothetical protein CEUSTIGMA_g9921.t1 [Chlamydomonas eustigma]|eukprot:GAX82494.1 hypothetical protein CEUSTIGMA_g9921.t1 [Chlamydomonas eustigma]